MIKFLDPYEAREKLLILPSVLEVETVSLWDALGRVSARDIHAQIPMPPFDRSPYDGYAFRGEDTEGASETSPAALRVVAEVAAGSEATCTVEKGMAVRVFTGAPIPPGTNVTIKFECAALDGNILYVPEELTSETDVIRAGEDLEQGARIIGKGEVVHAPMMGMLAAQGLSSISVFRQPRVFFVHTGDELYEVGTPLPPAGIYNSNRFTFGAIFRQLGYEVQISAHTPDDPRDIAQNIAMALESADLVVTTGGASVGKYDYAVQAAQLVDADILFWKTAMKPGGALLAAQKESKLILSLSGNPASAMMGLLWLALPYLRKLCGQTNIFHEEIRLPLYKDLDKKTHAMRLLRGHLVIEDGRAFFCENIGRGNGNLTSYLNCDLIAEIPPDSPPLVAGTMVTACRLKNLF